MDSEGVDVAVSESVAEVRRVLAGSRRVERPVVEPSTEILRGVREIAAFLRVHRKTVTTLIKAGLPVMPFGQGMVTTRQLLLRWVERQVSGDE
jgi:hypothetical protein